MARDLSTEIAKWEQKYSALDRWYNERKEKIAKKLVQLRRKQAEGGQEASSLSAN